MTPATATMPILDRVKASTELQDLLFDLCDFELSEDGLDPRLAVPANSTAVPFGRDGSGGVFFTLDRRDGSGALVIYASSEGQAGCLGGSLEEFFSIIAAVPHWRDCLKFSGGGLLEEMRWCDSAMPAEHREYVEDYDKKRRRLPKLLGVPSPADPVLSLRRAVLRVQEPAVFDPGDGAPSGTLFNSFTWKR